MYHDYLVLGTHSNIYCADICYHTHTHRAKKKAARQLCGFPGSDATLLTHWDRTEQHVL